MFLIILFLLIPTFDRWDNNHDGTLNAGEFKAGLYSLGFDVSNDRAVQALMSEIDKGLLLRER
jgi:Ca2+-binding EF-hand superfamily protein